MSRNPNAEMQVLLPAKFNEFCLVLGVKEMCCLEPEKKILEKAFRKKALKCHPDKGGDPIEFKKLNDAYLRLIGHIQKLDEQAEAIELANSVLIEISKASVKNWQSKLVTRYGWFKKENCKNIIFDGPFKQYMGRSKNTGNITVVLYEDPPDAIPKIHIRSSKYMAWIAEQQMPVHMHVEKGRQLAFDQWRIVHLAEFGIYTFGGRGGPTTPAPERKEPKPPKTPKSKRKGRDDPDQSKPKARRDSEPAAEPPKFTEDKENAQPPKQEEGWAYNCGKCGTGFANLMDHIEHKKKCVPDTEFEKKNQEEKVDDRNKQNNPKFECAKCGEKFTNMVWYSKHQGTCNKTMDTEEDEYSEFMKSETSKNDLNSQSKPPEKPPKKDETKSNVKDTAAPKPYFAETAKEQVTSKEPEVKAEKVKESVIKTKENEKATESKSSTDGQNLQKEDSSKMSEKPKDDPTKVRRFSAIIPDEPPEKFMDSPPKDIPAASCDHKGKETDPKHSRGEELTNGVTENGQKTKAENKDKKLNGVNNLNKDSTARPQNNLESDEAKTKKAGSTITKTGKITKTAKPELSKNGLSKAAEEVVTPKKTPTVEPMDVDEPETGLNGSKPKPSLKKNEMPMGSLLKDLPASSSSQAPNPEPTAAGSRVKFAPAGGGGGAGAGAGAGGGSETRGGLDAEALNLTRSILSTNTNDRKEGDEIGGKTNGDSVQQTLKTCSVTLPTPKSAEKTSALDAEAIRITDTFLHQGNEELSETPKVEKVPTKGILKKPLPKETVIQNGEQPEKTTQPTKENIRNETKKTLTDQTNKDEAVSKQDEKAGKVSIKTINESGEVKSERTAALPTGSIINSAKKNGVDLNNQSRSMEGKENQKVTNVISSADNSKSSQRVQPEAPMNTKPKTEPKTINIITNQDTREVKDAISHPSTPTVLAPPKFGSSSTSTAVHLNTNASATDSKVGQSSASRMTSGIKETSTTDLKSGTTSQPASLGSNSGGSQQSSNFYPAQAAVINKSTGPKLEVKHAQQKMMINSPLSPSSSRKDMTSKTKEDAPQIYSHLSGRTIASEKGGAKSPDPSVKSDIANLDSQHSEKMKEIQTRHEEREKKKHQFVSPITLTSSSVAHSGSPVSSSSTSVKETAKVQGGKGGGQTSPSRPDQVKTQSVERTRANKPVVASILNDVTSDLKKLDAGHNVQMKQIEEKFKEQELKTRQPPSTDHHSARPTNLGRSRFETGSAGPSSGTSSRVDAKVAADNLRTQFELDRHIPRRNETVHDMGSTIAREPSSVARSATTILDVKPKSPEPRRKVENTIKVSPDTGYASPLPRKRFDRNFNASPDPFPASKGTSNSRFSDSSSSYNKPTGSSSKSSATYTSLSSTALSTSKPYSSSSYSTPPSSYSFASPSSYSSSTSFPSPADSFSSSITSNSSYFAATPSTSYSSPSSLLDRSRSDATIANSKSSADLSARIQATKDQHKLDIKKAMDFDRTALKPPIITQKLPRPEPGKYSNISSVSSTMERSEREGRRMERERAVLERVLGDRTSRGKSDDLLAKTPSYRL